MAMPPGQALGQGQDQAFGLGQEQVSAAVPDEPAEHPSQRKHQRINAPMDVVIGGQAWRALDWSMTGFAIPLHALSLQEGGLFQFYGRFHVQGALMTLEMQAQVARRTADRIGCRFEGLGEDQMRILRLIHSAFRAEGSGSTESIMAGLARDAQAESRRRSGNVLAQPEEETEAGGLFGLEPSRLRRQGGQRSLEATWQEDDRAPFLGRLGLALSGRMLQMILAYGLILSLFLLVALASGLKMLGGDAEATYAAVLNPNTATPLRAAETVSGQVLSVVASPGDLLGPRSVLLRYRPDDPSLAANTGATGATGPTGVPLLAGCTCRVQSLTVGTGDSFDPTTVLARVRSASTSRTAAGAGTGEGALATLRVEALFPYALVEEVEEGQVLDVVFSGVEGSFQAVLAPTQNGAQSPSQSVLPDGLEDASGTVRFLLEVQDAPAGLQNGHPARVRFGGGPGAALKEVLDDLFS
ncbi:MAG: PilZ domain-containing protein [Rhodospirillaceae bacterium]